MRGTFEKHTQFRGPLSTSGIKRPYLSVICACARWPSITVISNRTKQRPYRTVWNASKCSRSRFWFRNAFLKLRNALITRGFLTVYNASVGFDFVEMKAVEMKAMVTGGLLWQ